MFPDRNKEMKKFTMVSNILIEEVFPKLSSLSECKLMLEIYRNTAGIVTGVDDEGETTFRQVYYITSRKLAEKLNITQKSVITGLHRLEKDGYIVKVTTDNKTGYSLRIEEIPTKDSGVDLPKNLG